MALERVALLETDRLILRKWTIEDAEDFFEYASDPFVGPGAGWKPHESIDESKNIIELLFLRTSVWAIEEKESGKVIGSVSLEYRPFKADGTESMELGYALGRKYWNKGFASEAAERIIKYAFEEMALEMLTLKVFPDNAASRRVAEKCGFKYIGELNATFKNYDGKFKTVLCYMLQRAEYSL